MNGWTHGQEKAKFFKHHQSIHYVQNVFKIINIYKYIHKKDYNLEMYCF